MMDSRTIGIPLNSPDGYRITAQYAEPITSGGVSMHSAPWWVDSQGHANVSHGCINLSPDNGAGTTTPSGSVIWSASRPSGSLAGLSGRFDLVTILEGLHDMARPVETLRAVRAMLADGGSVLMIDERVADAFAAPSDDLERYHYAWSVVVCLPGAMGDPQTPATGAVMRVGTLRRYAAQAGFRSVEVLPIETPAWRFYRLHP